MVIARAAGTNIKFKSTAGLENGNNVHVGNSGSFGAKRKRGVFHASVSPAEEVKIPKISHVSPIC